MLAEIDVKIDGDRPWDIRVHDDDFYGRVIREGSLGLGESYMDGWWDCEQLDELMYRVSKADLEARVRGRMNFWIAWHVLWQRYMTGPRRRAFEIAERHYDIGNDLFRMMLDKRMVYTCGYWQKARTLEEAQEEKLELICKKIGLKHSMRVLDIGGGWGSFAKYAAERYHASVVNITVSREQLELANKLCAGLPVESRLQDYRDVDEKFDAIVSLGMFEHVGPRHYDAYMEVARRCLNDDGLCLLHTIGRNETAGPSDAWIGKYIFPNSALPSAKLIAEAVEGKFIIEDWHNFGMDYSWTLLAWHDNFERHWPQLKEKYGERFRRMWRYYLLSCAGAFRARSIQLWQVVLSKQGVPGGYKSVR
ncbi:MAG: cyclopropane fatty acyl phospholipid synthase [Candidatus Andersenbacteria bacterium]|nr:cyclopropane fatty acyl phospholipid synthase [Candidatus Andersenbacteria bacterium]